MKFPGEGDARGKFGGEMSTQLSVAKLGPSLHQCGGGYLIIYIYNMPDSLNLNPNETKFY
jgi:hypothetical protein